MDYCCPKCKSENIQRLSVIYEGGLSVINMESRGSGVGYAGAGAGVAAGVSRTTGTSQTTASQRAAPPTRKTYVKPILAILVVGWISSAPFTGFAGDLVGALTWIAVGGWGFYVFQYNSKRWPPLKAVWDSSFLCSRCHEVFVLGRP
jgi:hypothetical protein